MTDFIKKMAYIVAESGDEPSYNDIYTICKKLGKEPDEETMTPEEYNSLPDDEKQEIHRVSLMDLDTSEIPDDLDTETAWKRFQEWKAKYDVQRGEDGYPLDWVKNKKYDFNPSQKKTFLFICENVYDYGEKKHVPEVGDYQPRRDVYKKLGTLVLNTPEEAEEKMHERFNQIAEKYHIPTDKLKEMDYDAIPHDLKATDSGVYGYYYNETFGEGARVLKKRGPKSGDDGENETVYDKKTRGYFFEYFIYRAKTLAKHTGSALDDIVKTMSELDDE